MSDPERETLMARELRFIDPAFRCEVVLSGPALALYEAAYPQFERLKGIKSLGLTSQIQETAMHTRHQHLLGLMRVFNKLCQQPKDKGLPKTFLWSFWCYLCFGQTGHAALSYDSEKAVLLACHLDSKFKAILRTKLQPVIDKLSTCQKCVRKSCEVRMKGKGEAEVWFDDLVVQNRWWHLHLWIAALKLLQEIKVIPILNTQIINDKNLLGFSEAEALKMLVAPDCQWEMPLRNLSRLDHVIRDLAFAGTLGIQLDVDNLISVASERHPDWKLLGSLNAYLINTLYESTEAQTISVLFQRALASLLIDGKITLDELFGIDLDKAIDDQKLRYFIERRKVGIEVFDLNRREAWKTWAINTYVDQQSLPCDVEKKITGYNKGYLTQHTLSRAICFKLRQEHKLAIAISHKSLAERPKAKVFVKLCRSIMKNQYPKLVPEQLTDALYEGLVDRRCSHGLKRATNRLSELSVNVQTLRKMADVVNKNATKYTDLSGEFSIKIGAYEYPFRGDPQELLLNTIHAALSGTEAVRKNLGMTLEAAAQIIWEELLDWQTVYYGTKTSQRALLLLDEAQSLLSRRVITDAANSEADLELYTLLEALKHPNKAVSFRVALPNLILLKQDGSPENEYDVVSVVLNEDRNVEVWVWGVTTDQNLTAKRNSDMAKIQRFKDLLGGRWESDVRVVTCYVHKDGSDICCEIDGRQERRAINLGEEET